MSFSSPPPPPPPLLLLPRFPQFTVPTLAQRVLPPMSLATPTTLPFFRPYCDCDGEEASGPPPLPFESVLGGEPDGAGAVREVVEVEMEEGGQEEEVLAAWA